MSSPGVKPIHEKPCAAPGLLSYRYRGGYSWIMIGAEGDMDALREAARSVRSAVSVEKLERWDAARGAYVPVLS